MAGPPLHCRTVGSVPGRRTGGCTAGVPGRYPGRVPGEVPSVLGLASSGIGYPDWPRLRLWPVRLQYMIAPPAIKKSQITSI